MAELNLLKRFKAETKGNVSLMFAVSFTATFLIIGAALDIMLLSKNQAKIQYLADAAALSALQYDGDTSEKEAIFVETLNVFAKESGHPGGIETSFIKVEETETAFTLEATVEAPHQLIILQNTEGFDSVSVSTAATMGIENIEIALVLDISSSMRGARLEEAKKSTKFFIDEILKDENLDGRVSISLVPFGGTVRVPEEMRDLLLYQDEVEDEENGNNGNNGNGNSEDDEPIGFPEKWIGGVWNQCFEFDASDIEEGFAPDRTYRPTPDYWSWNLTNPWCPLKGNEMVPLTDDAELLEARIDTLSLSDGTGSDHGMAWGYATLSDEWKNKFPGGLQDTPAKNKSATRKVLVFMTDGGITSQHFVRDEDFVGEPPFNSKRKVRVSYNDSLNAFYSVCDRAKEENIEVYTIGYTITRINHITPVKACATSTSHFIDAATGDLQNTFGGIAASISPLRTSM